MTDMTRRDAILTLASAVGTMAMLSNSTASAEESAKPMDKLMVKPTLEDIKPKALPFDPKKLTGISEKLIVSHWENNYMGSVKTLNAVNQKLALAMADKDFPAFAYNGLKREHLMRTGSVVLHDLYFENLGGTGKCSGEIEKAIKSTFGDVTKWETEFRRIGQGLGGGAGWVILGYNFHLMRIENYWSADHMHTPPGVYPLLVMDMYEHSYQMDYGAMAGKYIDAFFQNIRWEATEQRYDKLRKAKWI